MRVRDERLDGWMAGDVVLQHPFVTAEFGMGSFRSVSDRAHAIDLLESFQQLAVADDRSFHVFVAEHVLYGTGLGFADVHLLHACKCNPTARLATRDKRLAAQAERLGIKTES